MAVVELNRRFHEWKNEEPPDPEIRNALGLDDRALGWEELLLKRRVVIPAEAGSGKSAEVAERSRLLVANSQISFHATVEDIGKAGSTTSSCLYRG